MPAKRTTPNRFQRTRRDHANETAEDYVEAVADLISRKGVCRITELAKLFKVSHVTVTKIIARLKREGLVSSVPYGPIALLEPGARLAQQARRRHAIVHGFLKAIGVGDKAAEIDAEGIEHHVSEETLRRLEALTTRLRSEQA